MEERAPSLLLIAVMMVPLLSGCVAVGFLDEPGTSPDWEAGYTWEHVRSGQVEGEILDEGETVEEIDQEIDDLDVNRTVVNTTLEADDDPVYVLQERIEQDSHSVTLLEAVRQRDLAPVPWTVSAAATCDTDGCAADLGRRLGDPPEWTFLDFPLVPGKSWSFEIGDSHDGLQFEVHAQVGSPATADLPIGSTDVLPVEFTVEPTNLDEVLEEAREEMTDHGVQIDRFEVDLDLGFTVGWSPRHEIPAVIERRAGIDSVIVGTSEDGEPIDREFHLSGTVRDELSEAHLEATSERPVDAVAADGTTLLVAPPTQATLSVPTSPPETGGDDTLRIAADNYRPNAAEGSEVELRAFGVDGAAEGSEVRWSITHPDHGEVHDGSGTSIEYEVTDPGQHLVRAALVGPDGETLDHHRLSILAVWGQETEMSCDVVTSAYVGSCDPVPFPVASGVDRVVVDVTPQGMRVGLEEMRVIDADDQVVARTDGSQHTVEIDDFEEAAVDGSAWRVEFDPSASAFEYPSVLTYSDYDPVLESQEAGSASSGGTVAWDDPLDDVLHDAINWHRPLGGGDVDPAVEAMLR